MGSNAGLVATTRQPCRAIVLAVLSLAALSACGDPPLSDIQSRGGNSEEPLGVIEGSVLYFGPRPLCEWDKDGNPVAFRGVISMSLFGFSDPLPPDGPPPSSALNIPASDLFNNLADCMPQNPSREDLTRVVQATASFTWNSIPLGVDKDTRSYRISALFDRDGDYIPFFLSHNVPTFGDVLGGATVGFSNQDFEIKFGGRCDHPNGQVVKGVSVLLALPLWTERPMFEVDQPQPMDSAAVVPVAMEPRAAYEALRGVGSLTLNLISAARAASDCTDPQTPSEDGKDLCVGPRLAQMGLDYDLLNHDAYAWHLLRMKGEDTNGDGQIDETEAQQDRHHPVLNNIFGPPGMSPAARETFWTTPILGLTRIKTEEEKATGIPDVEFLGGVDAFIQDEREVRFPDLPVTIPPVASIELINQEDDRCDVFVYAPGNATPSFEAPGLKTDCQELPPGDYSVAAVTGVAGDMEFVSDATSDTGSTIRKRANGMIEAKPVGQLWIVPNDLGDEQALIGNSTNPAMVERAKQVLLPSQAQPFKIRDRAPASDPRPTGPAASVFAGNCENAFEPPPGMSGIRPVQYAPFDCDCCPPHVRSLCNVPRCAPNTEEGAAGTLAPTLLRAHVFSGERSLADLSAADLDPANAQGLTIAEARAQSKRGNTVVLTATCDVVTDPTAPADLEAPWDYETQGEPGDGVTASLTFEEWDRIVNPPGEAPAAPQCEPGAAPAPDQSRADRVRLKVVALIPSCVPFLMPMGCCTEQYDFMPRCVAGP